MSISIPRGTSDDILQQIIAVLRGYEALHPAARIDLYRSNAVSVRVRIIDPDFRTMSRIERHKDVWKFLNDLDDEAQADISSLILLAPEETTTSMANLDFEDPVPSRL